MDSELETIEIREILAVLRRQWKLVAGIALTVLAVAVALVLRTPDEYRAQALIRLEDERGALTGGLDNPALEQLTGKSEDPLLSQIQVMRSRRVASPVIDSLGMRLRTQPGLLPFGSVRDVGIPDPLTSDTFEVRFDAHVYSLERGDGAVEAAYGRPIVANGIQFTVAEQPDASTGELYVVREARALEDLLENFRAAPRENTDVVDVSYTAEDPAQAAAVVNAMIDEFRFQSAEVEQQQARMRRIFIEEQLAATDSLLAQLQLALTNFRERNQLFSSRELLAAQQQGLFELEVRREELAVDREIFRSLLAQLEEGETEQGLRTLVSSPGIAENPVIATLYEQLVRYEASVDSLTAGEWSAAPNSPDVLRLRSLVQTARERLAEAVNSHIAALDARIAALDDLRARNATELASLPPTEAQEARLVQQLTTMQGVADQLRAEYQRARIAEAVEVGQVQVVDRAVVPLEPVGGGRALKLMLGLVLGLMLGSGAAFLRENLNQSVQGKEDVERILRVPAIAVIPQIASANGRRTLLPAFGRNGNGTSRPATLVAAHDRDSGGAEAFRTLRTNLIFSQAVRSFKRIVVTSSNPGEGKTTTVANLAVTFAQQGMRVILLDCDLRRPQVHTTFELSREPGLTDRLVGTKTTDEVIRKSAVEGLDVVTCGPLPPNPAELLGGEGMRSVLSELGERYELVLLDTPPILGAADSAVLGAEADGVLLVVQAGDTDRGAAEAAMRQLHQVGAHVIGVVLNDPHANVLKYGGHYYYNYYSQQA